MAMSYGYDESNRLAREEKRQRELEETKPRKVQVLHVPATNLPALAHNEFSIELDLLGSDRKRITNTAKSVIDLEKTQPIKAVNGEITKPTESQSTDRFEELPGLKRYKHTDRFTDEAVFDPNRSQPVKAIHDDEITKPNIARQQSDQEITKPRKRVVELGGSNMEIISRLPKRT